MGLACTILSHQWKEQGPPETLGEGRFQQTYGCQRCKQEKKVQW